MRSGPASRSRSAITANPPASARTARSGCESRRRRTGNGPPSRPAVLPATDCADPAEGRGNAGSWAWRGVEAIDELAAALRSRLIERARAGEAQPGAGLDAEVRALIEREAAPLPDAEREALRERVLRLATGLGPLEPLLADPEVDEVMVNGPGAVYVERRGRLERGGVAFGSEAELLHAIERVLAPLGRRVDEASPLCDARLPDGSRVNVVIPPLSLSGPCLTIRRFRREGFSLRALVEAGTLARDLAELLAVCVAARASILVSGGTGCGKTTTLNALSGAIPGEERIVTIEDAAELRLRQRHVVRLEALALMAGIGLPAPAVREQVASALDLVVHQARLSDGSRVVESVTEVVRAAGGVGTRELHARGGGVRRPGAGPLAQRLAAFGADASVSPPRARSARPRARPR